MGEPLAYPLAAGFTVPAEPVTVLDPLRFRGHRLELPHLIVVGKSTPARLASALRRNIANCENPFARYGIDYKVDVLGETDASAQNFEDGTRVSLERFSSSDDTHPVKLVVDQIDDVCGACAKREHCTIKREDPSPGRIKRDVHYLNAFLQSARKLKRSLESDDISVIDEMAVYSNAPSKEVQSIVTTAGVARRVLRDPYFPDIVNNQYAQGLETVNPRLWTLFDRGYSSYPPDGASLSSK